MRRDIVISVIIGTLLTYLPFWQWDRVTEQIAGGVTFAFIAFILLITTGKAPRVGAH